MAKAPDGRAVAMALLAFAVAVTFGITGCASDPVGDGSAAATAPAGTGPTATPAPAPAPAPAPDPPVETPEAPVSTETTIGVTVNGTLVTATLQNSAATSSLLAQLPLDLAFSDFGGQEKTASLPAALSLDGMPAGSNAEPGTIGYYAPDQSLVLYYDSVGYYDGIIPLGTFDDVAAVRDAPAFVGTVSAN